MMTVSPKEATLASQLVQQMASRMALLKEHKMEEKTVPLKDSSME
jgi:hypothetical protein